MTYTAVVCAFALVTGILFKPSPARGDWRSDRELANDLSANGTGLERDRATIFFEPAVLSSEEMIAFADLVNQGILDIESYLGVTVSDVNRGLDPNRGDVRKVRYFVSTQVQISHSNFRSIYLPMAKVKNRTAPYLHETTHLVAPCDECPMWFSEGLASYVQSYVSENTGGYDGGIFTRRGNRGINQDARRWLASERGQAVVPFLGTHGEPPSIDWDRSNVAAPFYVMAQSFVKFLVEQATLPRLRPVFEAKDFDAELQSSTGKKSAEWKELWLADLALQGVKTED